MTIVNTNIAETININTNGTYDVARYTTANVNTPAAPTSFLPLGVVSGVLKHSTTSTSIVNLDGATDLDEYVLYRAYYNNISISGSVDFSSLTTISGSSACGYMFYGCTGLTSVDLSGLTTLNGQYACQYMFSGCTGITSVDLSSLVSAGAQNACYYMFQNCTGLTSINLSSLTTIGQSSCQNMFSGCTGLTSVDLSGLTIANSPNACNSMFSGCTSLATVYIGGTTAIFFGTRTSQFNNMFQSCTQNIDVYAPAANKTAIESFSGYPNFGGQGTVTWHWRS